jgi:uncharacterized protein (TIGR03437 family)
VTLNIGNGPVIQSVTSASSFQQVNTGQTQNIAPYDMISVFGNNFCSSTLPACSSNLVIPGVLNPATQVYQNWVATDAPGSTQRQLSVSFCPTGTTTSCINAPLLFATNNQINVLVPGSLTSGGTIDIIVNYGYGTGGTMLSSPPLTVNVVAANPGIFAVGADGQGSGAILGQNWALISATNPAGMRSTSGDSDTVQIYMTGLGVPDSTALNTGSNGSLTPPTDCLNPTEYLNTLNTDTSSSLASVDGAIIQGSLLLTGKLPPCLSAAVPTVKIGNQSGTVLYAGWVEDSVAGLYQVNVTLPASGGGPFINAAGTSIGNTITAPVQLPVVVTANGVKSQTGVTMWVAPRLKVLPPSTVTGGVGVAWATSSNAVAASEGTSPYRYAVTSGTLPTGLSLSATTGAITGTPAAGRAGSYVLTVTATDSANVPLTGTATFTLTIAGGLILGSNPATYSGTVVSSNTSIVTVTATGGAYPYAYSFDSNFTPPTGMTINSSTGAITITSQTPAGAYNVQVDAVDTNGWTGTIAFTVTLSLQVAAASGSAGLTGTSPNFSGTATGEPFTVNLSAVGGTGTANTTFTTPAQTGFSISGSVLTITAVAGGPYTVVITASDNTLTATGTITLNITLN